MKQSDPVAYIHQIGTCVPENVYSQDFILRFLLERQGRDERLRGFLRRIYEGTAIERRHMVIEAERLYDPSPTAPRPELTTAQRNDIYIREADRLALQAARRLFEKLPRFDPGQVSHLITVSCTGFSAPGFDLHLVRSLPLSPGVRRFHLGFMGCYAAFPALELARTICRSEPRARVLIVDLEICSLHFQRKLEADAVVAASLFADGAAAALVSALPEDSPGRGLALRRFLSHYLAGSEEDMAWKPGDTGFDMKLSRYVPLLLGQNIRPVMDELFRRSGIGREQVDLWAIHPGGRAILEKVADALELAPRQLGVSYEILRDYGNMSSATILFVLERLLDGARGGRLFAAAFGPGLTIECGYLEKNA